MSKKAKYTRGPWVVRHSHKNAAFNVIGTNPGLRYKIARCPYLVTITSPEYNEKERAEAEANAKLIADAPFLLAQLVKLNNILYRASKYSKRVFDECHDVVQETATLTNKHTNE